MSLKHGEILQIKDILQRGQGCRGSTVRVMGRLKSYDVTANLAFIDHQSAILCVDTSLLGAFQHQMMSVFQFIGELEAVEDRHVLAAAAAQNCQQDVILRARVVRCVDGLDTNLYDRVLSHLQQQESSRVIF